MKPPEELDQTENKPNPPRFVEELADENDYWMSLTDAARITRTSEPMVRRWVSTGRLPVRKEPVGINQRTRLVRASDVSLIRPIIDPTAAITDDIHKLDLLSIPRQQEQIIQDHQHSLKLIQGMRQQIEEHVQQTRTAFEQGTIQLQQQIQEWNRRFALQQTEWQQDRKQQQQQYEEAAIQIGHQIQGLQQQNRELTEQGMQQQQVLATITNDHATLQKSLQEGQHLLEKLDQDIHHQIDQIVSDLTAYLRQQEHQSQKRFGEIEQTLAYYDQAYKQIQQEFLTLQEMLLAGMAQQRSEIDGMLERRWSELLHERTVQYGYMKLLEQRLASVEIQDQANQKALLLYQERDRDQERQIQMLVTMLHDERAARQMLSEQFTLQQERLQSLSREWEARCLETRLSAPDAPTS